LDIYAPFKAPQDPKGFGKPLGSGAIHDGDLFGRESIGFIDELVDLAFEGGGVGVGIGALDRLRQVG
jgi:hypothetical protein